MTINDIVSLAQRVHDRERVNLGTASTRDQRNAFWARVIGIAHWGLAEYGVTGDPQWHIKRAAADRPQSDDVVVSMPSREYWDCIPGSGADGYRFEAHAQGRLDDAQIVYAPPKPVAVGGSTGDGGGTPLPAPPATPTAADLKRVEDKVDALAVAVRDVAVMLARVEPRVSAAAFESLNAASRASEIKTQIENLPKPGAVTTFPAYEGRVFGSKVRLEPK